MLRRQVSNIPLQAEETHGRVAASIAPSGSELTVLSDQAVESAGPCQIQVCTGPALSGRITDVLREEGPPGHPDRDLRWLQILARGLGHEPLLLEALRNGQVTGRLPLVLVRSLLFGRFLVSLPYVSTTGIQATEIGIGRQLIDEAVRQAAQQKCHHLALRHEFQWSHPALTTELNSKVHMRLELPQTSEDLWNGLKASVRNQVRKGQNQNLTVRWGSAELLNDFHAVFSRNMRDLGTPVYGRKLFAEILQQFGSQAEICTVSLRDRCVAAALLVHGSGTTVVPSASSLQKFNSTNANMLMYWNLLKRAVERGQQVFDFGRSTRNSGVFRFKKQWGARPHSACWQFHVRHGAPEQTRPESRRNQRLIRVWRRLPVCLTRIIGPRIVRGIP